jgi:hypothetical protein
LRDWRATDPHVGKEPVYEGPFEPSYDGPEDWELAAAREKLKTWHLHISAGIDRFKKKEQVEPLINQSILHTLNIDKLQTPEQALDAYHELIDGEKVECIFTGRFYGNAKYPHSSLACI